MNIKIIIIILFVWFLLVCLTKEGYSSIINHKEVVAICNHYNKKEALAIDCILVSALIRIESDYRIESYNSEKTGSYGLMQIQCGTAKARGLKFGCEQLFGKMANIRFGMKHLYWIKNQLVSFTRRDIVAVWNAGMKKEGKGYVPQKCKKYNKFQWQGFPSVECYPGEYINEEYVWKIMRYYKYLKKKHK